MGNAEAVDDAVDDMSGEEEGGVLQLCGLAFVRWTGGGERVWGLPGRSCSRMDP